MKMDIVIFKIKNQIFYHMKRAAISKATYLKQSGQAQSAHIWIGDEWERQVSLYCAFSSNHAASFSFALNI